MTAKNIGNLPSRLLLNGRAFVPSSAELTLYIATEDWVDDAQAWLYGPKYLKPEWNIEIIVNDSSGEDGAVAPSLTRIILDGRTVPPIQEWPSISFGDSDGRWSDAWYGNDAPRIQQNHVAFGDWLASNSIFLKWTAICDDWDTDTFDAPFLFEGPVIFKGIKMQVKEDKDAIDFLSLALPRLELSDLVQEWENWLTYSDDFPADRRRWHPVIWMPK